MTRIPLRVDPDEFRRDLYHHLLYTCVKDPREAGTIDVYRAMAHSVRDRLVERWLSTQRLYVERDVKRVNYLSAEFLTGRSLGLCLVNLGLFATAEKLVKSMGYDLTDILEAEGDPGLGNGGLGRLAACFMDSLATLDLPAVGYGIHYQYGLFKQEFRNGYQVELPDAWINFGTPWEIVRPENSTDIKIYG